MQEMTLHVTNSRKTNQTNEKQDKKENSFLKSKQYLSLISNMNKILNLSKAVNAWYKEVILQIYKLKFHRHDPT